MANQPAIIPKAWASDNTSTASIPETTTESGKASWSQGFPIETSYALSAGGIPPKYGDFNGVLNVLSQFAVFAQAGGQFAYTNLLDYTAGCIVVGTDGALYACLVANGPSSTTVNPVGDTSGTWTKIATAGDLATYALDSAVVKLSGAQSISGTKQFNAAIVAGNFDAIKAPDDTHWIGLYGGSVAANGALMFLYGKDNANAPGRFMFRARNTSTYTDFIADPDGTLTWGGKDIITNGGNQTIGGVKTFTESPIIKRANPYLNFIETDVENGVTSGGYQGILFFDKKELSIARILCQVDSATLNCISFHVQNPASNSDSRKTIQFRYSTTDLAFEPVSADNQILLGSSGRRWKQVWAGTGTIQTSDERLKSSIAAIPDAVLDAWGDLQWQQFKFNDAVAEKGDNARLHTGLVAQRIDEAFKAHDIDASAYGMFCHDTWEASQEKRDPEGYIMEEAREAGDAYSLRYDEALCLEAAYQRRRADRAEARIATLEQRLDELEAALASLIAPATPEDSNEVSA